MNCTAGIALSRTCCSIFPFFKLSSSCRTTQGIINVSLSTPGRKKKTPQIKKVFAGVTQTITENFQFKQRIYASSHLFPLVFIVPAQMNLVFENELKKANFPLSNLTSIWHYTDYIEK